VTQAASVDRAAIVAGRVERLRELIYRHGAQALVLDQRRDFAWLTLGGLNHVVVGSETGVAPIVVTATDAVVVAPMNEFARIRDEEVAGLPLDLISVPWWDAQALTSEVERMSGDSRALAARDVADELQELRSVMIPFEHERMTSIAALVNGALDDALAAVARGTTEDTVAAVVGERFATAGARLPVLLVAADERISRYRHPIPTDTRIQARAMVVVVAERWGLHVAATRFVELEPRTSDLDERAAAISDVLYRMRAATTVGSSFGDAFAAARAAYADHGMADEWQLHHQGGSIGYGPRERIATPGDGTPIKAGMAFAWNPSTVGYKAEETLLLDAGGEQHVLTTS
jgi:Xaa-Pro aminopeptidase